MYDIIGDVHGQADLLKDLLSRMGYKEKDKSYFHPQRKAVFVGDFINRGPKIKETIRLIRNMVEKGHAYAILGNHEINAIFYTLLDKQGQRLSKRWSRLRLDLHPTLAEYSSDMDLWKEQVDWMRTLPLFLELDGIRIVHACWDDENIRLLKENLNEPKLKRKFLKKVEKNNKRLSQAFWETCKGIDFELPKDLLVFDSTGNAHRTFRLRWWKSPKGQTFRELSFESRFELPNYTIPAEIIETREPYPDHAPLVFFGHYCMKDHPNIIKPNICCVDSCVSRRGKLTAYRWSGETRLKAENLID